MNTTLGQLYLKELEAEAPATRKCLERIPGNLFDWKPIDTAMKMGNMAITVADIPKWLSMIAETGEIDFATYPHVNPKNPAELVKLFDDNMEKARKTLSSVSDEALDEMFYLKNQGKELAKDVKKDSLSSTLNHLVHHRGQLTVYMRLNGIPVPAIYGPSGDENVWG